MISIVVAIDKYPFFVYSFLGNLAEMCGVDLSEIDVVVLTPKNPAPKVLEAIEECRKKYPFRTVEAPFTVEHNYSILLDWAIRNANLRPWAVLMHSDLFWRQHDWLKDILAIIKVSPDAKAITPNYRQWGALRLDDKPMLHLQDCFGVFRIDYLIDRGLSFSWGVVGQDAVIHQEGMEAIRQGRLSWTNWELRRSHFVNRGGVYSASSSPVDLKLLDSTTSLVPMVDWLDGTAAMSIDFAVTNTGSVIEVNWSNRFLHLRQFYRIGSKILRSGNTIFYNEDEHNYYFEPFFYYSAITSLVFDRQDVPDQIIPWAWSRMIAEQKGIIVHKMARDANWLSRYYPQANAVGEQDDMGVNAVTFLDRRFDKIKLL